MVVVHRAHGFRFIIYVQDHEPAHVHVGGSGQAKIQLIGADGLPRLIYSAGMKGSDERKVLREVSDRQLPLLREWKRIHGGQD